MTRPVTEPRVVVPVDSATYRLPPHLTRVCGSELCEEMSGILAHLDCLNREHVGEVDREVFAARNGDPAVVALADQLCRWFDRYIEQRLARRNPRDDDAPVERFHRVHWDLAEWLDRIQGAGVSAIAVAGPTRYFAWRIYRETWRSSVRYVRSWGGVQARWSDRIPRHRQDYCATLIRTFGWGYEGDLRFLVGELGALVHDPDLSEEAARATLRRLAGDLARLRCKEGSGTLESKGTISELATSSGTMWVAWVWAQAHLLGTILLARSREEIESDLQAGLSENCVAITLDGRMAVPAMPWITLESAQAGRGAWAINVLLLEAAHRALLSAAGGRDETRRDINEHVLVG